MTLDVSDLERRQVFEGRVVYFMYPIFSFFYCTPFLLSLGVILEAVWVYYQTSFGTFDTWLCFEEHRNRKIYSL